MTERDEQMLKRVYDFRFLRSDLIYHLINENGKTSEQNLSRRLQALYHNGYLDRPQQHQVMQYRGSDKIVYAIGNKGHDHLFHKAGLVAKARPSKSWTDKNRVVKYPHIEHTLMIANLYTCLVRAEREHPYLELVSWEIDKDEVEDRFSVHVKGKKVEEFIRPDAYFMLADDKGSLRYLLEADRSTMTLDRFLFKLKKYWLWKFHAKRARARFGSDKLIILSVTPSQKRRDNLRHTARRADDKRIGSEFFWFASQTDYSPEDPQSILAPIWYTPVDNKPHSLLE